MLSLVLTSLLAAHAADPAPHVATDGSLSPAWHVRIDTSATWGIGGQMFLGAQVHPTVYRPIWTTRKATGTLDLGVNLNYGNEPTFLAPWIDKDEVSGATHRIQALATVGGTFHLTRERRFGLGLHGFVGSNSWISSYTIDYADEDFTGSGTVRETRLVSGAQVTLAYRFHRHVGANIVALAQVPLGSSYATGFGHIGAGLTFYAR